MGLGPVVLPTSQMPAKSAPNIWDPDTSELRYSLAGHTSAVLSSFRVLNGSNGTFEMTWCGICWQGSAASN